MADETTPLVKCNQAPNYRLEDGRDAEIGDKTFHIDRMFLLVALLGTQCYPLLGRPPVYRG